MHRAILLLIALTLGAGCASTSLNTARQAFYQGNVTRAAETLADVPSDETNRVLMLMERGMMRHALGQYEHAAEDWVEAARLADRLDYLSVSRSSASMVINDRVQAFRGAPYERMLLHAFTAQSFFALGRWDDAAVEARNLIYRSERLNGFPDSAWCRYLAGFCMEMIRDPASALQYRRANELLQPPIIDPDTGSIGGAAAAGPELVIFLAIGHGPTEYGEEPPGLHKWGRNPYAEFHAGDRYLGRSQTFSDTARLSDATLDRQAALRAAKTATRIAIKEAAARAVEREDEVLGEIVRMILFALEASGERRWETLPRYLQVARFPCPTDLTEYRIVLKGSGGQTVADRVVDRPLTRRGDTYVSFLRIW
jgi:tetratricopeptide (TPR) repeat protein